MKQMWCGGMILLLLCLTACGSGTGTAGEGLYYEASGIPADAVLLTVDGREVPARRYFYWLTYNCDYLSETCAAGGQTLDWSGNRDGQTLAEYVGEQALRTAVLYATIENWAETYDCGITRQDREDMDREWETLCHQYGGQDQCLTELAWMGLTREDADAFTMDYYRYSHLYALAATPDSRLYPDQEAVKAFGEAGDYRTVDRILISTDGIDEENPAALAERRERADMVLTKLSGSTDPEGYFSTLAGMYSDAPREEAPEGVTFSPGDGRLDPASEQAAQALETGQWSGVTEVPGGLAIFLRRPLDLQAVAADYFDARLQQAASEAEVVPSRQYGDIDPADFYQKLTAAREQLRRPEAAAGAFAAASAGIPEAEGSSG